MGLATAPGTTDASTPPHEIQRDIDLAGKMDGVELTDARYIFAFASCNASAACLKPGSIFSACS